MYCGVGRRLDLDPTLLWLWCRLAAAAPIRPLVRELPYTAGVALKQTNKKSVNICVYIHTQVRICIYIVGKEKVNWIYFFVVASLPK